MKDINKIIVLRFRRVGDAVISTVLCSSLKRTFPQAAIHYVLNETIAPLFENHPDIDQLIRFSEEDMKTMSVYTSKVRRIMKAGRYDMIVDTRSTIKTLWFALFSMKTPYRIGKKKAYNAILHNYRTGIDGVTDEVTKTLLLLKPIEKQFNIQYDLNFKHYLTDEEKDNFRARMIQGGIDFAKPVIVCAVTSRQKYKAWNTSNMKSVLFNIIEQYDAQLIFNFGGKEEKEAAITLCQEMGNHPDIFTNIEAINLRELASMLSLADFFFGNEGGPRHISQALNVPGFAIYPHTASKAQWLPNACERFQGIEPKDVSDKANDKNLTFTEIYDLITAEEVWIRLNPMLEKFLK